MNAQIRSIEGHKTDKNIGRKAPQKEEMGEELEGNGAGSNRRTGNNILVRDLETWHGLESKEQIL